MQYCQKLTFVNFCSAKSHLRCTCTRGSDTERIITVVLYPSSKRLTFLHFKSLKLFFPACVERFALWPAAPFVRWPSDPLADGLHAPQYPREETRSRWRQQLSVKTARRSLPVHQAGHRGKKLTWWTRKASRMTPRCMVQGRSPPRAPQEVSYRRINNGWREDRAVH
jgi:hypothetical protein